MCRETAVLSLMLRTRWMSPGGAKPLTSPVRFGLLPASIRAVPSSESVYRSSYSTPFRTPNTHQVTWSWMRVTAPGCQTMATIEAVERRPFAEGKRQIQAFYIMDLPNMDAALEWAHRLPAYG